MNDDYFDKLPDFLKEYVYNNKWTDFKEIQKESFNVLFNTSDHLLISSGTSSGKTEAAMFPIITDIYKNPTKSIGALYVCPLKALINDQFDRVMGITKKSGIIITSWHGDIPDTEKKRIIEHPTGILQITPESLQTLLMRRSNVIESLFKDLKYIVIDEIHSFMNSDRGLQLQCEIATIERISKCKPRRIGLSATLSDLDIAANWLAAGTSKDVHVIQHLGSLSYKFGILFFELYKGPSKKYRDESILKFFKLIHRLSTPYNCIVFANNKHTVESAVKIMNYLNEQQSISKNVVAHHGSISGEYRAIAEKKLKDPDYICTAVATSTLELGIDVGNLDRVIHISSPNSVSSFVQKIGRSGRRNGKPTMIIVCNNQHDGLIPGVSLDLIRAIATAELYFKDKWVEPIEYSRMPFSLLYQQTLAYICAENGALFHNLVEDVLSQFPFKEISVEDYKTLVIHMLNHEQLHQLSDNVLVQGINGEKSTNNISFSTIFVAPIEFKVVCNSKIIGTVQNLPIKGQIIQLAGESWLVKRIDERKNSVEVISTNVAGETYWNSGQVDIHTKIMKKMYNVLFTNEKYPYLKENCISILEVSRNAAKNFDADRTFVPTEDGYNIFPWLGSIQFTTLCRILELIPGIIVDGIVQPYYIGIITKLSIKEIKDAISDFKKTHNPIEIVSDFDVYPHSLKPSKYDKFIPTELLKKQYSVDRVDFNFDFF